MSKLGTIERPLRVAVVGSGPSGFYTTEALFATSASVHVDMFDRLPTPFGLVRYGVAPDHPKIKNVIKIYERIASHQNFAFLGNVKVGHDIRVEELKKFYDAVIFACGAETDKKLGIPGEDLPGSYTATEFVAWYNGHPDYKNRKFDLSQEVVVIIGQGNVAVDVCRILAKNAEELKATDIAQHALDALATSRIKEIHLVGRRGPIQTAFTPAEIEEFEDLTDCDPIVMSSDLKVNPESYAELGDPENLLRLRNWDVLQDFAFRRPMNRKKKLYLEFLKSPMALVGKEKVEKVIFEKNQLSGSPGHQKAKGTGEKIEVPCGLFFRSVGYRGIPIDGVPFDEERGIFPNQQGRVLSQGQVVEGLYCVGWIKRGAMGVIGTNRLDSAETAKSLLDDIPHLKPCATPDAQAVRDMLKGRKIKIVSFDDWKKIDALEIERGKAVGKPREKFTSVEEMLSAIGR